MSINLAGRRSCDTHHILISLLHFRNSWDCLTWVCAVSISPDTLWDSQHCSRNGERIHRPSPNGRYVSCVIFGTEISRRLDIWVAYTGLFQFSTPTYGTTCYLTSHHLHLAVVLQAASHLMIILFCRSYLDLLIWHLTWYSHTDVDLAVILLFSPLQKFVWWWWWWWRRRHVR